MPSTTNSLMYRSGRHIAVIATALMVLAAAVGFVVSGQSGDIGRPLPRTPVGAAAVTLGGSASGARCAWPPSTDAIRDADLVVAGTVSRIGDGKATLQVSHFYKEPEVTEVVLPLRDGFSEALGGGGDFTVGQSYLIAASDGDVLDCLSAKAGDELQQIYETAFPSSR